MELAQAIATLQNFYGKSLTLTLSKLETDVRGANSATCPGLVGTSGVGVDVLAAAGLMKRLVSQNNVVIHAVGILLCLPHLLEQDEIVEYVSLGAGNTGRFFDLETNKRIAEFKFIRWQGGPESIRQNSLFKDFYLMAESGVPKKKYLYVLGTDHPLKFFNGGRALDSVLSRHVSLKSEFSEKYGTWCRVVRDYYALRKDEVLIQDVSPWVPGLVDATQ